MTRKDETVRSDRENASIALGGMLFAVLFFGGGFIGSLFGSLGALVGLMVGGVLWCLAFAWLDARVDPVPEVEPIEADPTYDEEQLSEPHDA